MTLRRAIESLAAHYGPIEGPPAAGPFELILWENVAYLASPERRREAFAELKRTVGTTPEALRKASPAELEEIASRGILKGTSAAKLRACADIALDEFGGNLAAALDPDPVAAMRALRRFPGIGEPGAEKILLFTGRLAVLAPESNGLRVLTRLGILRDGGSYARTYASSHGLGEELSTKPLALQEAHLLLQHHGRTLCRRSDPACDACPLAGQCAHALTTAKR